MATYNETIERANYSARDLLPVAPVTVDGSVDWQGYADALESLDIYDAAHEEADSWDTVIYHYKAMALCTDVPSSVLHEAESQWEDCGDTTTAGLYELASTLAYWIVYAELIEAMESLRDDMLELCQNQMDNMEGELL